MSSRNITRAKNSDTLHTSCQTFQYSEICKRTEKIIFFGGIGVLVCLIGLIVALIVSNSSRNHEINEAEARADSLRLVNDRLQLSNEFNQLNAEFSQYEDQQVYLKNDSLVKQYNQARMKVEGLLKELNAEKRSNSQNRARIKQLEGGDCDP